MVVVALTLALWPAVAAAHVTVSPSSAAKGAGDVLLSFRVPNELPDADVVGLRVEFPTAHPIAVVSPSTVVGWTVSTKTTTLTAPVKTDDGTFTEVVSEVDWTGGSIPPGQFGQFDVLAEGLPNTDQLVFKALQQYSNGQSVAWIDQPSKGDPDPQHPAPVLQLTAAGAKTPSSSPSGSSGAGASGSGASAAGAAASGSSSGSNGSEWIAVVALIVAGFAIALSLLVLWLTRPSMRADLVDDRDPAAVDAS